MIKQIEVTLLVEVDTEDQEICPSGNPLLENVVLNTVDDGFFMSPVKVLSVKDLGDLQALAERLAGIGIVALTRQG